jgi:type VI secretion system protein ImpH
LRVLLGLPVTVEEFVVRRRQMDVADQTQLGLGAKLGESTFAGAAVYVGDDAFRIVIGARTLQEFETLLPSGEVWAVLREALKALAPGHLEIEIEIGLNERVMPAASLSGTTRLGWTSWLEPRNRRDTQRQDVRLISEHHVADNRGALYG